MIQPKPLNLESVQKLSGLKEMATFSDIIKEEYNDDE